MINSIEDLFKVLNEQCNYIVLRNWNNVFDEGIYCCGHEDIDILCEDRSSFIKLTKAKRIHIYKNRDNFIVPCGDTFIRFDVRWVGDGYYPTKWEQLMLERKTRTEYGVYIPSTEDYFYSLSYHALLQKQELSEEYLKTLQNLYKLIKRNNITLDKNKLLLELKDYLRSNKFIISIPNDPAVFINWTNLKRFECERNTFRLYKRYLFRLTNIVIHIISKFKK